MEWSQKTDLSSFLASRFSFTSCKGISSCFSLVLCYIGTTFFTDEWICHSLPPTISPHFTHAGEAFRPATPLSCPWVCSSQLLLKTHSSYLNNFEPQLSALIIFCFLFSHSVLMYFTVLLLPNISHKDFLAPSSLMLKVPTPLDTETGWTGELWSKKHRVAMSVSLPVCISVCVFEPLQNTHFQRSNKVLGKWHISNFACDDTIYFSDSCRVDLHFNGGLQT